MFNVKQFIYTTASIENKKGYQIVAKSEGVSKDIIKELESYVYPIDVDPSKFNESRSLVLLKNDLVAYSRIKNIGTGYDGRENTLYNHTFIFLKNDFEKYGCDSRIFDKFYLEDKSVRGILPTLSIEPSSQLFPIITDNITSILEELLASLFMNKKIALLIDDVELPQKLFVLLPKSMRLNSFSTHVVDPKKQPKYKFILNSNLKKLKLEKYFSVISNDLEKFSNKTEYEKSIYYYTQLIKSNKVEELAKFQKRFEEIDEKSDKNKLILLSNYFQFLSATNDEIRMEYAEKVYESVKQFNQKTFSYYFEEIKDYLKTYKKIEKTHQLELNPVVHFWKQIFNYPQK